MNLPAMLIGAGVGAAFFAAELTYYYTPAWVDPDRVWDALSSDHSKARAAVSRLLINPASAQFGVLRSVEAAAAGYVCGEVKAKDNSGQYSDYRPFVYTVAVDFARIDDDGRIAQRHASFHPCPVSDEARVAQQKSLMPPGLSMVKNIQKIVPKAGSGTMEQQLGQLAGQATAGASGFSGQPQQQAGPGIRKALGSELEWRGDRTPSAWPAFPPDHPLARSTRKRTAAQALALAKDVEDRWEQSRSYGNAKTRPSSEEVEEACRALLAIDPKDKEFAEAWGVFVRLRKIDREIAS